MRLAGGPRPSRGVAVGAEGSHEDVTDRESAERLAERCEGILRIPPLAAETTWSLICRLADGYGQEPSCLLGHWRWENHQPRHPGGAPRADTEVLLIAAGRALLARLCGIDEETLRHALPSWEHEEDGLSSPAKADAPQALWRAGSAVIGPVAFGCRLCTGRRTGQSVRVVRYAERWERVCGRHRRWLLDADADQPLENLDLRGSPETVAAQRRWGAVGRRAQRAGVEPGKVFALARAVVCRWWEHSLHWEQEEMWPHRLQQASCGKVGGDVERWRAVARDAVIFPEVVAVAGALLDRGVEELVWTDSGGAGQRPLTGERPLRPLPRRAGGTSLARASGRGRRRSCDHVEGSRHPAAAG